MRRFLLTLFVMVMIPYVTTLAWTGRPDGGGAEIFYGEAGASGAEAFSGEAKGPLVLTVKDGRETPVPAEEFLVWVVARQIPPDYGPETIKAQAVLARTYLYRELSGRETIREEALDLDVMDREQMEEEWGEMAPEYARRIETAVKATEGVCLTWEGELIEPFFCRAAAGMTRTMGEERPYLKQTESPGDPEAKNFETITVWSPGAFAGRISAIPGAARTEPEELLETLQVVERDAAGYVVQVQAGQKTYTGEELQYALGLPSACYTIGQAGGRIRITCRGIGHGYGFSQAGANALEREGLGYEELLNYYFQNVECRS